MENILTVFTCDPLQKVHLNKDVLIVGDVLSKKLNYSHELVGFKTPQNSKYVMQGDDAVEGVYSNTKVTLVNKDDLKDYLIKFAEKTDVLILFHASLDSFRLAKLYKKLNRTGKVYIKLDMGSKFKPKLLQRNVLKMIYKILFIYPSIKKHIDIFSIETSTMYNYLKEKGLFGYNINDKLVLMPNGISKDILKIPKKSFVEKENLIITVGRLGSEPKNNEMFLEALKNISLKDWKVAFIGPYTNEFKALYDEFILQYPNLAEKVILTGNIDNREELYSWYNRAKAFVLTSKWESYGFVLTEALAFGNYLISTDVGCIRDVLGDGHNGEIINNEKSLAEAIDRFIEEDNYNSQNAIELAKTLLWKNVVQSVIEGFN